MKTIYDYIVFAIENGLSTTYAFEEWTYEFRNFDYEVTFWEFDEEWDDLEEYQTNDVNTKVSIMAEWEWSEYSIAGLICSREFLEAVTRGLNKDDIFFDFHWQIDTEVSDLSEYDRWTLSEVTFNVLTHNQAIAIRDDWLTEFINNLLW